MNLLAANERSHRRFMARLIDFGWVRPEPPREISYVDGVLSWKPPADPSVVTHYNIYAPDEFTLVRQVPFGQTRVHDLLTAPRVFLSSLNATSGLESEKVLFDANIAPAAGSAAPGPVTLLPPVIVTYEAPNENGTVQVKLTVTFSPPNPAGSFDRVRVWVEVPAGGNLRDGGEFPWNGQSQQSVSVFLPPPVSDEQWRVYVVSGSKDQWNPLRLATQSDPSPNLLVDVGPIPSAPQGQEWAPLVANFTALVEYGVDDIGGQMWRVTGTFTPPAATAYRGVRIVGRLGTSDRQLSVEPRQATAYVSPWYPVPQNAEQWTIYAQSIGPNNRVNSIVPGVTPAVQVTISRQSGLGGVNLALAVNFDLSDFEISGAAFRMRIINADKIQTGTLRVGGGGSKPGQIGVFDAFNQLVGWIGVNAGFYGAWFKQLWVGGTDPTNAPFFTDSSGRVAINALDAAGGGPLVKLSRASVVSEVGTAFEEGNTYGVKVYHASATANSVKMGVTGSGVSILRLTDQSGRYIEALPVTPVMRIISPGIGIGQLSDQELVISDSPFFNQSRLTRSVLSFMGGAISNRVVVGFWSGNNQWSVRVRSASGADLCVLEETQAYFTVPIVMAGQTVINTSRQFVGAGVACPNDGIGGAGFNIFQGGSWWFGVAGPTSFQTADGKTVTVRGGVITAIV